MVFSSHVFIFVFLPLTLLALMAARRLAGRLGALVTLTAASLVFYGYWDWRFLSLLAASILFNYGLARLLLLPLPETRRRALLAFGVATNLLVLAFFKYMNFFLANLEALLGQDLVSLHIILPLGISFITFQKIAYLVDVWRDRPRPYAFLDYCLFVTFFPQLIAGPIVHHKELIPQLQRPDLGQLRLESFNRGLVVFTIGLAKKVLIADTLAGFADPVFAMAGQGAPMSGFEAWAGTVAYALQLYFDFSGYADMAIGLGLMVGIWLPENFDRPYNATSIADFWRRWHMTLSRFLRDYLYIPLGGSRVAFPRQLRNLMLTMLLGGIWHGAGWAFLLWGALHGGYLCVHRLWSRVRPSVPLGAIPAPARRAVAWALTLAAVLVAWVPFRAEAWATTWVVWQAMFVGPFLPDAARVALGPMVTGWLASVGVSPSGPLHLGLRAWSDGLPVLVLAAVLAVLLPNGHRLADIVFGQIARARLGPATAVGHAALAAVIFVGAVVYLSYSTVFLYYQF